LNDSQKALSVGLPGREKSIFTLFLYAHISIICPVNFPRVASFGSMYVNDTSPSSGAGRVSQPFSEHVLQHRFV
jgi:hypothetical protein